MRFTEPGAQRARQSCDVRGQPGGGGPGDDAVGADERGRQIAAVGRGGRHGRQAVPPSGRILEAWAQVSPVITERRNSMITGTFVRTVADVPDRAYPRDL
ncbi:hypothetical protein GCM10010430_50200 [Kitasatospora cystarginea]|uniref:Uncharacterized protein n=1 Tax=Kitasatospora cystarginea TaxID=58350 RepID=A0ABN3EJW2_9ACTN